MNRPALFGTVVGGFAATALAVMVASSSTCVACSAAPENAPDGTSIADTKTDEAAPPPVDTFADAPDARPDTPRTGDGWIDGEYCPSAAYPPRDDGCPCWAGDNTSPYGCTDSNIGKACEYFQNCPPGPSVIYRCMWGELPDGGRISSWKLHSGGTCPSNDSGS